MALKTFQGQSDPKTWSSHCDSNPETLETQDNPIRQKEVQNVVLSKLLLKID